MKPTPTLTASSLLAALAAATAIHAQETAPAPTPPTRVAPAPTPPARIAPAPTPPARIAPAPAPGLSGGSGRAPTPALETPPASRPEPFAPPAEADPSATENAIPTPAGAESAFTGPEHPYVQPPGASFPAPGPAPLTLPPAEGSGYGGATIPGSTKPIPSSKREFQNIATPAPVRPALTVVANEHPMSRGEDIIRETKLRVFQRHYETVLNQAIQARIALLDATPENQESLKARQAALEEIAGSLEEEIRRLSGPPLQNVIISPAVDTLPEVRLAVPTNEELPIPSTSGDEVIVEMRDAEGNTLLLTRP
ncbi:MAG: hypothetical protein ACKV19_08195 [Verrucomicrobiales bacterium]